MIVHLAHGRARARDLLDGIVYRLGRLGTVATVIAEAIGVDERDASAHITLGDTLDALGHLDQAASSYARATELDPSSITAYLKLSTVLRDAGRHGEADAAFGSALGRQPRLADDFFLLANGYLALGRPDDAMASYREALNLDSGYAHQHYARGVNLQLRGRRTDANRMVRWGLTLKPDDPELAYILQAIEGASSPARAPDEFVTEHFDRFAETFDSVLERKLQYRTPRHLLDAIRRTAGKTDALDVLDIGCGTGLCGPLLRPLARRLVGVDLSPKMVDKARERGVYDEIRIGELTAALAAERAAYDLIVSADVLVYFGDMTPVFAAVARALRPNGIFAFSVERFDGPDFILQASGRYAHSAAYLRAVARLAGLDEVSLDERPLRLEGNSRVRGHVGVFRLAQRTLPADATNRTLPAGAGRAPAPSAVTVTPIAGPSFWSARASAMATI
jgi:predicted TPR repeat methyltransferase